MPLTFERVRTPSEETHFGRWTLPVFAHHPAPLWKWSLGLFGLLRAHLCLHLQTGQDDTGIAGLEYRGGRVLSKAEGRQ